MAYDTGYTSWFKMANEATWGTKVEPTGTDDDDVLLLDSTGDMSETQNITQEPATGTRKAQCLSKGNYGASGSLSGKLQGGRLIAYALGDDAVTSAAGLTTHTMTPIDTTDIPSFTLRKGHINTAKGQDAVGCKISDFSINLAVGGQLTGSFNWMGKQIDQVTTSPGTRDTLSTDCVLPSYTGTVSWNSNAIEASAFTFNYNNTLGGDEYSLSDRRRKVITQGMIDMNGTFTLVFSDFTVYDDFQTTWSTGIEVGTARALTFTADNGGATTAERELSATMADAELSEVGNPIALDEKRVTQEYTFIPKTLTNIIYKDEIATDYILGV